MNTPHATPSTVTSLLQPSELFTCAGRTAIVTGGASGIGYACAEALGAAGAKVALLGLQDSNPVKAAARLSSLGIESIGIDLDITDDSALAAAVTEVRSQFGSIDTVLANAGAALDQPRTQDADSGDALDRLDRMYSLHVRSVSLLANLTLPGMAKLGNGVFLIMSSLSGLRGNRVIAGYGVSKAANAQIARNIAVQWGGHGIRANAISPGVITTEFARPITDDPDGAPARLAKTPLGRFGTPGEVAGAVVWLASPAGAFVSGQNIVIDGGTLSAD